MRSVQVRRQLEYSIAEQRGIAIVKPPNTLDAVADIVRRSGVTGLYTGFRLHFGEILSVVAPSSGV
jgi:solute carrier family 25 (mitochondrial carnitine/acylcarnitine transporter), member 20/29